jgi:molybdate transport system ATP-binding protein
VDGGAVEVKPNAAIASTSPSPDSQLVVNIRKRFLNSARAFDLNIHFRAGAGFTILFGSSGAGKTTTLDCVAGLANAEEGRITIGSEALFDADANLSLPPWKRRIGYVIQDLALFPHLTAGENVAYGLSAKASAQRQKRVRELLNMFHIEHLRERRPAQLSGGEKQRVALARALATEPRALLLDEPLAALDRPTKGRLIDDLRQWNETRRVPILYVTHSMEEVFALGEQVVVLDAGRIIAQGRPHEVMRAPRLETVAQLSGFENVFDVVVTGIHEDRGTMTCRLGGGPLELETPLVRADIGSKLSLGIRAGDLMLATETPRGLSARNVIPGIIRRVEPRDVIVSASVDCGGAAFEVHLTLAAREALALAPEKNVWVVLKTHSCHLMVA